MAATFFPRFSELATELQMKIWGHAIDQADITQLGDLEFFFHDDGPRHPKLTGPNSENCFSWYAQELPPDDILLYMHVCSLSRQVFLEKWKVLLEKVPVSNRYWMSQKKKMLNVIFDIIQHRKGVDWFDLKYIEDSEEELENERCYFIMEKALFRGTMTEEEKRVNRESIAEIEQQQKARGMQDFFQRMEPAMPGSGEEIDGDSEDAEWEDVEDGESEEGSDTDSHGGKGGKMTEDAPAPKMSISTSKSADTTKTVPVDSAGEAERQELPKKKGRKYTRYMDNNWPCQ